MESETKAIWRTRKNMAMDASLILTQSCHCCHQMWPERLSQEHISWSWSGCRPSRQGTPPRGVRWTGWIWSGNSGQGRRSWSSPWQRQQAHSSLSAPWRNPPWCWRCPTWCHRWSGRTPVELCHHQIRRSSRTSWQDTCRPWWRGSHSSTSWLIYQGRIWGLGGLA